MSLRAGWNASAERWLRYARDESFGGSFPVRTFLDFLPEPGRLTIELGSGEGRLARELAAIGHRVVGVEVVELLARAAVEHVRPVPTVVCDAAAASLRWGVADLVVAFMSLHDIDEMELAVLEAHRLLTAGGRFCIAIGNPITSIGDFSGKDGLGLFQQHRPYFERVPLTFYGGPPDDPVPFHFTHRPLEDYMIAIERAGFLVEALREPCPGDADVDASPSMKRWQLLPSRVHVRAVKPVTAPLRDRGAAPSSEF